MVFKLSMPSKHGKCNMPFHIVNCTTERNTAGMFHIRNQNSELCLIAWKVTFNANALTVHMPCELLDLFFPQRGKVKELYFGTMVDLISFIRTGRQCIVFEKSSNVFNAAQQLRFGILSSAKQIEWKSEPKSEMKFEEGATISATEAYLLINFLPESFLNISDRGKYGGRWKSLYSWGNRGSGFNNTERLTKRCKHRITGDDDMND